MNRFDVFIGKINFKRVTMVFLITAVIAGLLSAGFLAFTFRDKLSFVYEYHRMSEKAEDNAGGPEALKPKLAALADRSPDMVDILILNSKNKILFSAKNSYLSKNGVLELTGGNERRARFLTDRANPDVYFRLVKDNSLSLSKTMLGIENEVEQEYRDRYFYENDFAAKKVYMLSYIVNKSGGNKIYFISDVRPVANGKLYVKAVAALAMLFFMLYWVLLALWVYSNALRLKLNAVMWGFIALFTNLAGLLVFLIYRQNHQTCYKCGTLQSKANGYCTFCGTRLGMICENCNAAVNGKDRYCKNCGSELNGRLG